MKLLMTIKGYDDYKEDPEISQLLSKLSPNTHKNSKSKQKKRWTMDQIGEGFINYMDLVLNKTTATDEDLQRYLLNGPGITSRSFDKYKRELILLGYFKQIDNQPNKIYSPMLKAMREQERYETEQRLHEFDRIVNPIKEKENSGF